MSTANGTQSELLTLRRWSSETLAIDADASLRDQRRALFDRVRESTFEPPEGWGEALRLAVMPPSARPATALFPEYHAARRKEMKREIEQFAGQLFQLTPDDRKAEFERLASVSRSDPELHWRLRSLKPALSLGESPASPQETRVLELVERLKAIFVAPPRERPRLRQELRQKTKLGVAAVWTKAAQELSARYPEWAALESRLVRDLTGEAKVKTVRRPRPQSRAPQPSSADAGRGAWLFGLMLVMGLLRVLTSDSRPFGHDTGRRSTPPPVPPAVTESLVRTFYGSEKTAQSQSTPQASSKEGLQPTLPEQKPGVGAAASSAPDTLTLIRMIVDEGNLSRSDRQFLAREYLRRVRRKYGSNPPDDLYVEDVKVFVDLGFVTGRLRGALDDSRPGQKQNALPEIRLP